VHDLLEYQGFRQVEQTKVFEGNQAAIKMAHSPRSPGRKTKHLGCSYSFMIEDVELEVRVMIYIPC
jgi:hypothetical protein